MIIRWAFALGTDFTGERAGGVETPRTPQPRDRAEEKVRLALLAAKWRAPWTAEQEKKRFQISDKKRATCRSFRSSIAK